MSKTTLEKSINSAAELEKIIGKTWFRLEETDTDFTLETRENGCVSDEEAGQKDIDEGERLYTLLRKHFPATDWKLDYEVVDEWVTVNLRKLPLDEKERAAIARSQRLKDLKDSLHKAVTAANLRLAKEGYRPPFASHVHDGHYGVDASIYVSFGKRYLYVEHSNSRFIFAEKEEAKAALESIVSEFSELNLKWKLSVREPVASRTANRPPPQNIIEEVGEVRFEASLHQYLTTVSSPSA